MHNIYMSNTQTVTTQSTQTIKITKAYFEYPTGDADAPDRERVEGTYNVLVDGVDVGQVARDEWVTAGYWGAWKAGRDGFEKRGQAVAYLVKRYNDRLAAEAEADGASEFPESLPSDYAMFTTAGNAAVAAEVRAVLAAKGRYYSEGEYGVLRATYGIVATVAARGMSEAEDTMVRDGIYSVLTGAANEWLGI